MERAQMAMVVGHLEYAGMDRKKFAEFAENRKVYRQRFPDNPNEPIAFFVMGRGDERLPLPNLDDLASAEPLIIVAPSDGLNVKMLSILWLIDVIRGRIFSKPSFAMHVVRELGKDAVTGEVKFGILDFYGGLDELLSTIAGHPTRRSQFSLLAPKNKRRLLKYLRGKSSWVLKPGGAARLSNALTKRALCIVSSKSSGVTMAEIMERIPKVKPLCAPGNPEPDVLPDIENEIQVQIDSLAQEKPDQKLETEPEPASESEQQETTPEEAIAIAMQAVSEHYGWEPEEVKLRKTPSGYVIGL